MLRARLLMAFGLRQIGHAGRRVSRVSDYLSIAALRLDELKEGIRARWQDFSDADLDTAAGLMPWEQEMFERVAAPRTDVLVVGCGSGRDLFALIEQGCRVTGIDPAGDALDRAQRGLESRHLSAALIEGFFEDVPLSGRFDLVVFSHYCYALIPTARRRIAALEKASTVIKPGGQILVSYVAAPRPRPILVTLGRMMGALCRSDWRIEPGDVVWGLGQRLNFQHMFESGEVDQEAAAARLRPAFRTEFPLGTVAVVLQRI
jgi:SAM-dependent methyltransferase